MLSLYYARFSKTLRNAVMVLAGMLYSKKSSSAIRQGYIRVNPLLGLELPELQVNQIVPPTAEEVWKLIDAATEMKSPNYGIIHLGASGYPLDSADHYL